MTYRRSAFPLKIFQYIICTVSNPPPLLSNGTVLQSTASTCKGKRCLCLDGRVLGAEARPTPQSNNWRNVPEPDELAEVGIF